MKKNKLVKSKAMIGIVAVFAVLVIVSITFLLSGEYKNKRKFC